MRWWHQRCDSVVRALHTAATLVTPAICAETCSWQVEQVGACAYVRAGRVVCDVPQATSVLCAWLIDVRTLTYISEPSRQSWQRLPRFAQELGPVFWLWMLVGTPRAHTADSGCCWMAGSRAPHAGGSKLAPQNAYECLTARMQRRVRSLRSLGRSPARTEPMGHRLCLNQDMCTLSSFLFTKDKVFSCRQGRAQRALKQPVKEKGHVIESVCSGSARHA